MATNADEFSVFQARILDAIEFYRQEHRKTHHESEYVLEGHVVVDFNSQYGSESSLLSYVAANLAGKPCVFPSYGDYTQACVFRTYGLWWQMAPSRVTKYRRTPSSFTSQDYIEITFSKYIYPEKLEVFETYNPGAIVRILACDKTGGTDTDEGKIQWVTLWAGLPKPHYQKPNIFSPPLRKIDFTTNLLRLELNHDFLDYYTELDGVKLYGRSNVPHEVEKKSPKPDKASNEGKESKAEEDQLADDLTKCVITDGDEGNDQDDIDFGHGIADSRFSILPKEIIHLILTYLNTTDLCRLAQTCRFLRDHCYDPLLYTELNLQPYWTQVANSTLHAITSRCSRLQRLNLSWCGKGGHIYSEDLEQFFKTHNSTLQEIEFAACPMMDSNVLTVVVATCTNLTELNLAGCQDIDDFSIFKLIHLKELKRLNLYRTNVDFKALAVIFRASEKLEHLNIGSCLRLLPYIEHVMKELGAHCNGLKSLDMWRLKTIDDIALSHLYNGCPLLEELDVGWCTDLISDTKCFIHLAQNCRKLKKIFLTANRTVHNRDMKAIADYLPDMEQLDILGTREVNKAAISYLLESCKKMIMLDVSFCVGITFPDVFAWRSAYPRVDVKKSFQNISAS